MGFTIEDVRAAKAKGEKLVMLTAYDYPSALIAERAEVPLLLVGDSLGMVVLGHETTLPVTLDDMVAHAAAVARGAKHALIVVDLPFLTYATEADAIAASRRLMQESGAHAVKLEGGAPILSIVRRLTALGVPVMGHLGFTPQSQHQLGVKVQAKSGVAARRLLDDALALEEAGAFALVLELIPSQLASYVTDRLTISTIGIGAGQGCDGQVQVWHDLLGMTSGRPPRHAKRYADLSGAAVEAVRHYVRDVHQGIFPGKEHSSAATVDLDGLAFTGEAGL